MVGLACGLGDGSPQSSAGTTSETGTTETSVSDVPPDAPENRCTPEAAERLYRERIAPLMVADRESTCNECHLSGVDLALFLQDSPCTTMACMVEHELVDLSTPEDSVVLQWILRANTGNGVVTPAMIAAEHEGMRAWIEFAAECQDAVCEPVDNPCGRPPSSRDCTFQVLGEDEIPVPREFDDPGDCRPHTLEAMFSAKVYSWRSRCYPCHFTDDEGTKVIAPQWIEVGPCDEGSLVTMRNVLEQGLVDLDTPVRSKLLLKPLAEFAGGIEHGGGDKFNSREDGTYRDFLAWIDRMAACERKLGGVGP